MKRSFPILLCIAVCSLFNTAYSAETTVAGFDGGSNDGFMGNAFFEATGGNPGGNANHLASFMQFVSLRTGGVGEPSNPAFLGDYSSFDSATFSFDIRVDKLSSLNGPISRDIGIALIDRDIMGPSGPSGVFFTLATMNAASQVDWTPLSVTIDDPTSATLPAGWIGFGDESPTFEPILPAGATFASVLAGVDEFQISAAIPGFFFNSADTDVHIDNVAVTVPEPGTCVLFFTGLLALGLRRR
jgi:hypothetical protein